MSTTEITAVPGGSQIPPFDPRELWLAERKLGIGGSDVHHLFPEESKYGCTLQLWYDKTDTPQDYRRTPAELRVMERGHLLEDVVADIYENETGRRVFRKKQPFVSKQYPFARVNIDRRIVAIDDRGPGVLEIKTYNPFTWKDINREGLPISVPLQVQHAMMVTGYTWGAYAPWEPAFNEFVPFDFERDEKLIGVIVERETSFWSNVIHRIQPDPLPDFNDKRCKTCQWRKTCRGEQAAQLNSQLNDGVKLIDVEVERDQSPELAQMLNDRKEAAFFSEIVDRIDDQLKAYLGEREVLYSPAAQSVVNYKWQKGSRTWDSKALAADSVTIGRQIALSQWVTGKHPELVAEFCQQHDAITDLEDKYKRQGFPKRVFQVMTE